MKCTACGVREAVGYCEECKMACCRECGRVCTSCRKGLCPTHQHRGDDGKVYCGACFSAVKAPAKPAAAAGGGGFSFQDLQAELGDLPPLKTEGRPAPTPAHATPPAPKGGGHSFHDLRDDMPDMETPAPEMLVNPDTGREEVWDPDVDAKLAALLGEASNIRMEALSGSQRQATPIWLSGLFTGGMSMLLCMLIIGRSGFEAFQPYVSYAILMLSVGTVIWCGYGVVRKEDPPKYRRRCWIGLLLGLLATFIAFMERVPDSTNPY